MRTAIFFDVFTIWWQTQEQVFLENKILQNGSYDYHLSGVLF